MRQFSAANIRNIALAGHAGAGKTSLAEALLYKTGATDRLGKISDGNTICDFDPEEIKRKASLASAVAPFTFKDIKVNILDTPGLFDFAGGMYEGIRAAETVVVALSAKSGVPVGAEKAVKVAKKMGKTSVFFVTQMDVENADFFEVIQEIKDKFGTSVCPMVVPVMKEHKAAAYVDVLTKKAFQYDKSGKCVEIPLPESIDLEEYRSAMSEAVAETDEELMEKFFAGEEFTDEEMMAGMKKGMREGTVSPVFCGSAATLEGIDLFLYAIYSLLPSPADIPPETVKKEDGAEAVIKYEAADPFCAYVFKTVADPFVGKMSFVKIRSGKLTGDMQPINSRTGAPERLGKMMIVKGKKQEDTACVEAGDICVISKLSATSTGDTLCDSKRVVSLPPIQFPEPELSMAVTAKAKGDEGKISQSMQRLMEEDPTLRFYTNTETKQQILSGMGEQHLDVVVSKLKNKFGIEVALEKPVVPYRETIRKKCKVEGKHKKQTGGHGQYGHVWIEFEPCDSEELVFQEAVFGGSVPKNFFPAIEKGLRDSVKHGVLAGYPVVGIKATLLDGSYHPVDSSEMAFKTAANLAYKAGMAQASPTLLEPIASVSILAPESCTGDIMGDMNKRRGRVLGMNPAEDGLTEIAAEAPMAEMFDFSTSLRSIAQGRGSFTMKFERYEQLPSNLEAAVIEAAPKVKKEEE